MPAFFVPSQFRLGRTANVVEILDSSGMSHFKVKMSGLSIDNRPPGAAGFFCARPTHEQSDALWPPPH